MDFDNTLLEKQWEAETKTENDPHKNNTVNIIGKIVSEQEFSHEVYGEGFYKFNIESQRLSEIPDIIPVTISERLCDRSVLCPEVAVNIVGQLRSYNNYFDSKNRLIMTVFAKDVEILEQDKIKSMNQIYLNGFVCKKPVYRKTPFGREISDILIAVNRAYGKSDYIPLIAWGRNARFGGSLSVGDNIQIWGRIQSRKYQKKLEDGDSIEKTAYEVSVSKIERASNTEDSV